MSGPLHLHQATVLPEWVDYNGHMNDAMYNVVFSDATEAIIDYIGMDAGFRQRTGLTIYTMETHVCYLQEVDQGEPVAVTTQLLDSDSKRLRIFHALRHGKTGELLATSEQLLMCIDNSAEPRAAPFAAAVLERVEAIRQAHADLPRPEQAGRAIGIRHRGNRLNLRNLE